MMEELIEYMETIQGFFLGLAKGVRTSDPEESYRYFKLSQKAETAARELKKGIPIEMELEGGGMTWWHVCPECHGNIDSQDHFCRHCGQAVGC